MDSQFYLNTGGLPWRSLTPTMETHANDLNSPDCFINSNFETNSTDQSPCFESALSSIVSSPSNCNNMVKDNSFLINELIGKLGNISNGSGEISRQNVLAASTNTSCYNTPLSSPPKKRNFPVMDQVPNHPSLAEFAADPGFIERAARFSCFGGRSFNGRNNQIGVNNVKSLTGKAKLPRAGSSPWLKAMTTQIGSSMTSPLPDLSELGDSSQESTVSEQQTPNGDTAVKASIESNSRKRKAGSRGKAKKPSNARKEPETNGNSDSKRIKPNEGNVNEKIVIKTEEEKKATEDEKQDKSNTAMPPEPLKDYIHVRARRGQATDSHSLAERVRREKISERMKLLQDLVPGCNKVTGKALMLDEIINYVQALQQQVEFLSMKLALVNTNLEANIDTPANKEVIQSNPTLQRQILTLDTSIFDHQPYHANISNETLAKTSMDPLDSALYQNLNVQFHPVFGFNQPLPQYQDELQSIVQMGLVPKP